VKTSIPVKRISPDTIAAMTNGTLVHLGPPLERIATAAPTSDRMIRAGTSSSESVYLAPEGALLLER